MGHLVRCVALAEELASRGWEVLFLGDLGGIAFAERQLSSRGLPWRAAPAGPRGHLDAVRSEGLDAVVLDSYTLPEPVSAALVEADVPVLAFADGPLRGQRAQLYLDQNIGAEDDEVPLPPGARRLAGTRYALLRDAVREARPPRPWRARPGTPSVVVSFGGTDAFGLTAAAVRALLGSGEAFRAVVVTVDPDVRDWLAGLAVPPGSEVTAREPFDEFPRVLARADLVVGAAGTSSWEYCCLGVPAAVAAVVDNQRQAYHRLVAQGAVLPLGTLSEVRADEPAFAGALAAALADPAGRARVAAVAHGLVDGDGRVRVVDALAELAGLPVRA